MGQKTREVNMDEVISALAGALWPAAERATESQATAKYWALSGGDCPQIIREVHKIINNCFFGAFQQQVRLVLQLLAYRLPTLLLAGRHCIKLQPPFVCSVPEMPAHDVQAMLQSWAHSRLPPICKVYKALKCIISAAILTHIDPQIGTNPFFEGVGYTPGDKVVETGLGPEQPVAAIEEVLASATVHIPELVAKEVDMQAYLTRRGFATQQSDTNIIQHPTTTQASTTGGGGGKGDIGHPAAAVELWYDAVVVGSGAGGGVSAALLSAAGLKVLVLEKAGWVRSRDMSWVEREAHDSMYEQGGFVCTADGGMSILAGSTLGGGTKINWTVSLKTPDHVRQEWASAPHNLPHLAPGSKPFDDALAAVCKRLGVSTGTVMSRPNANLLKGCQELGLHAEELPRDCLSKKCSAYCNFGCRSGHKQSSDVCWLVDAVKAGAQILTGVEGHKVVTQPQVGNRSMRVTGLVAISSSKTTPSDPPDTLQQQTILIHSPLVIASCGSLHTPALLLRSGITVGGNVGKHLRLHPAVGMVGIFQPTAEEAAAGRGAVNMYEGVSMGAFSRAAANWSDGGYGAMVSVPAAHPGLLAVVTPDSSPGGLKELMSQLTNVSSCVIFTRDSSSGRVTMDSAGRRVINYWPCQQTLQHLLEGQALACRALVAAGAMRIILPNSFHDWQLEFNPSDAISVRLQQLEDFLARVRRDGVVKYSMQLMSAHQMGSCRMGATPESSAVDATGECWDVSGLYVADASLFPTASGVNPMITVYGLSFLVASGIAARWKAAKKAAAMKGALDTTLIKDQNC